ncbi:MAG: flavodoxin family protein [Anaerolineaceae bacterium]|nr:flavodoxin family protein [Anaerolineaceae bacterium]
MNVLIIYDTVFGNTATIAQSIGDGVQGSAYVKVVKVDEVSADQLKDTDMLIIGSPTRGFRPTEGISEFMKNLTPEIVQGKKAAVFDTRVDLQDIKSRVFRFVVKTGGFAAKSLAKDLTKLGAVLIADPEGFLVTGDQGKEMVPGEPERATGWGKNLLA